ncbi:MAG: hypothetical protein ACPIOQ_25825 [Promethearchaeia archaeon]
MCAVPVRVGPVRTLPSLLRWSTQPPLDTLQRQAADSGPTAGMFEALIVHKQEATHAMPPFATEVRPAAARVHAAPPPHCRACPDRLLSCSWHRTPGASPTLAARPPTPPTSP